MFLTRETLEMMKSTPFSPGLTIELALIDALLLVHDIHDAVGATWAHAHTPTGFGDAARVWMTEHDRLNQITQQKKHEFERLMGWSEGDMSR